MKASSPCRPEPARTPFVLQPQSSGSYNATVGDVDVFSLIIDGPEAFGNFMRIRGGAVVQSLNLGFKLMIEEEQESVLATFIAEIQSKFGDLSKEIIVPFAPEMDMPGVEFRVPVRGDKLALLELSARNAKEMRLNALKQQEHSDPDAYKNMVMESLQKQLGMSVLPMHIEYFCIILNIVLELR